MAADAEHVELLRGVAYDLAYFGQDPRIEQALVRVIAQLPEIVRDYTLERCRFVSVGEELNGVVLPGRIGRTSLNEPTWIVVLSERIEDEDLDGIVAHEIAHAWFGHDRLGMPPEDCETKAANLALAWGFTGTGTDADYCEGRR